MTSSRNRRGLTTLSQYTTSIGGRLALGFGSLLALLLAVAAMNAWSLHRVGTQVRQIVEVNNRRAASARELLDNINLMAVQARSIVLLTDTDALKVEALTLGKAVAGYTKAEKALSAVLSEARADERRLAEQIATLGVSGVGLVQQIAKQGLAGANIDATTILTQTLPPVETQWRAKVNQLIALQAERNASLAASVGEQARRATLVGALLALVAVAVGVFVAWRIARGVRRPIERAVGVAERIAQGALDTPVEGAGGDELGRLLGAMRAMQERLRSLVSEIRSAAASIHTASAEVTAGHLDLSRRTEQASAKLQQTASSMEQLTGSLRHGAEAATQANRLAHGAADIAQRGGAVVAQVVATMGQISGSSKKIADIIGVIDGIAFQTNILALNAAVEAAQAGDSGRGFAVVAGEVRVLAQRSASAAREIKELIGVSMAHVDAGTRLVGGAGGTMAEIVSSVQHVSDTIGGVTAASTEQSDQIHRVNRAIVELDQTTQQNAALVEQGAAAAQSLEDQARRLTGLVAVFSLGSDTPEASRNTQPSAPVGAV